MGSCLSGLITPLKPKHSTEELEWLNNHYNPYLFRECDKNNYLENVSYNYKTCFGKYILTRELDLYYTALELEMKHKKKLTEHLIIRDEEETCDSDFDNSDIFDDNFMFNENVVSDNSNEEINFDKAKFGNNDNEK